MIFSRHAQPEKARAMSAYMKDHFPFFGIQKPEREALSNPLYGQWKKLSPGQVKAGVQDLWELPERELQYFALEVLKKTKYASLSGSIELFEWLIIRKSWWDTVDLLAAHLVGSYFKAHPEDTSQVTDRWIHSSDMWLQRSALLFQLTYKEKTDFELLKRYILIHRNSQEFFIQKAMGWALRQYARTEPLRVKTWTESQSLPPLTRREALKHLH